MGIRELARRTRAGLRPVLSVVQPLGWAVLGVTVVALVVGLRLDWRELVLLGLVGLVVLLLALPWLAGRTQVRVELRLDPQRVVAGHSVTATLQVHNTATRRHRPLLLDLPVGEAVHRYDLPALAPGASHEETFVIRTERRGVIPVGPATVRRGDPLGLLSRDSEWAGVTEVLVRPPMVALDSLGTGLLRDLEGVETDVVSESDLAFHALREYVPGDDLRHVHWRSSAKLAGAGHGQLLVRQYLDTRRSHATFVVDDRASSWGNGRDQDTFEVGLAAVASLVGRAVLDEIAATVVCGDAAGGGEAGQHALDVVCRARQGSTGLLDATVAAAAAAPETSLLFLVGGDGTGFDELQRAAAVYGPDVRTYALVVDPATPSRVRELSGISVLSLARLGDLPGLLHWSVS